MKLQEQLLKLEITSKELAEKVGTDAPMISKFSHYKCLPVPDMLKAICKVLRCEISDIYSDEEIYVRPRKRSLIQVTNYKLTVNLPKDAKEFFKMALKKCGYKDITDWITHCYKNLQIRYKIIERAEKKKALRQNEKPFKC